MSRIKPTINPPDQGEAQACCRSVKRHVPLAAALLVCGPHPLRRTRCRLGLIGASKSGRGHRIYYKPQGALPALTTFGQLSQRFSYSLLYTYNIFVFLFKKGRDICYRVAFPSRKASQRWQKSCDNVAPTRQRCDV